jgi:dTDP-glucose 4,6-dehydratase
MRILITGGAGFIGSNFVRRVLDGTFTGFSSVTVLDKLTYAGNLENLPKDGFEFIQGDICDEALIKSLVNKNDVILNFAAESHVDRSILDPRNFMMSNILGVQVLLNAVKERTNCRFLQVSTDEVYGSLQTGSADESSPLEPNSPYAASKASADLIVRSFFRTFGTNVLITRSSNNYGPFQFPEKLIPLFVTNLIQEKKLPIYGNGKNVRDWIHVDDNCRAIFRVLVDGVAGETYNIGGGNELSNLEVATEITRLMGTDDSKFQFVQDRAGHDFRYSVDASKIGRELDFSPTMNFVSGLGSTIDWYQKNEAWWRKVI